MGGQASRHQGPTGFVTGPLNGGFREGFRVLGFQGFRVGVLGFRGCGFKVRVFGFRV